MSQQSQSRELPQTLFASARPNGHDLGQPLVDGFADYLRRELAARRWSVRYLGVRSGVNHSTISRLLNANRTPSLQTVLRLQQAFAERDQRRVEATQSQFDPMQRVADALAADPALDARGIAHILHYYRRVRTDHLPVSTERGVAPEVRRIAAHR